MNAGVHLRRRAVRTRGILIGVALVLWVLPGSVWPADPGVLLAEARSAFDRGQYDRALELVDSLTQREAAPLEARRLKVNALLKLNRPADALTEYDRVQAKLGREEPALLREVAKGFIIPLLRDMREQMRGASYTALKALESEDTVPYFEDGLSDGSGLVRALAVEGLGRLPAGRKSPRLRKALEDQAGMVRVAALRALGRSGDRTVLPLVEKALQDDHASVRVAAAGALVQLGRAELWTRVEQAAHAAHPEERAAGLRLLGDLQDKRALPILREALTHAQPSVRGAAAAALGDLGIPDGWSDLAAVLDDPIPAVRITAAVSLGELQVNQAVPALQKLLNDPNPIVRGAACSALLRLGRPYQEVGAVIHGLAQDTDPGIRAFAARALGKSQGQQVPEAVKQLHLLLSDPLPRPRIAAARSLGQVDGGEVVAILKAALRDQDEAVKATAGGALGQILSDRGKRP